MFAQFVERLRGQRGATARPVEIFLYPGMVELHQVGHGIDRDHLVVRQHSHPVADLVQRIEIVGDEEHGQAQRLLEALGQLVERGCPDGVEAGGGLVQEQQFLESY